MMGIVKLTKTRLTDPQDDGRSPGPGVVHCPNRASADAVEMGSVSYCVQKPLEKDERSWQKVDCLNRPNSQGVNHDHSSQA